MGNRWSTSRLEAFSDGVFAIAITLLVLEIAVPESDFDDLWHGIGQQWPSYLAYVTSFVTIGAFWLGHHAVFRRLDSADDGVMRLNLLLLMLVSFLPFPTRLMAEGLNGPESTETTAVIFYGSILAMVSVASAALWRYIALHRDLLNENVSDAEVDLITNRTAPNILFYVAVVLLAVLAPKVAAVGYLVVAVGSVMRQPGDRHSRAHGRSRGAAS